MKREKISEAMGNISSRHIEEAAEFKAEEKPHRSKNAWMKWVSIAACFALIVCMFPIVNYFVDTNKGGSGVGEESANANPLEVGAWYVNSKEDSPYFCTNIFYKSCEKNKITILLEKADDRPIYWHLKGMNIKDSWLDENGKPDYDATSYYASTNSQYEEYGIRVENAFKFIVNGEETSEFPTQAGLYEITIDFSKLADMCTELDPYLVSSYEAFYIVEEKTVDYPHDWKNEEVAQ